MVLLDNLVVISISTRLIEGYVNYDEMESKLREIV
jgi:hypothetical protein